MTQWLWLLGPVIVVVAFWLYRRRGRETDLGSVSARWVLNHRRETHLDD